MSEGKFRILITDRFDLDALALLTADAKLDVRTASTQPLPKPEELSAADGLIIRSRTKINADLLSQAPNLKLIVTSTSGFDHIDFSETAKRGIKVMYTPNANAASACEMTWALVLACARHLVAAEQAIRAGKWRSDALAGAELHGKTYGVIGLGRIGSRVANIARAFGMKIIAFDPYKDEPAFIQAHAQRLGLEEVLRIADIVSFHVPATPETRNLIGRTFLQSMNRHAILVNTSRGSVIDESDLAEALQKGNIAACGLDVFEREPLTTLSPLLAAPNLVLSPHVGAATREAFAAGSREAAEKLKAFVSFGHITDPLPPNETWWEAGFGRTARPTKDPVKGAHR